MASTIIILLLHITCFSLSSSSFQASTLENESKIAERIVGQRHLLSFKETPLGSNRSFECSPSGPCVPCQYSEKNDEKYRCSETGYRIPLRCLETEDGSKGKNEQKSKETRSTEEATTSVKHRRSLLDDSSASEDDSRSYITYRSCIPALNEEKLSVLGFEGTMLCLLLLSGSFIYFRRKRTVAMTGVVGTGRTQTNSRF